MNDRIVPFGKHKGKQVEVLASDKEYLDWLIAQSWFKEKYTNIYNIVLVNNFREPTNTPEHNKLQIKFLKPETRFKLAYLVNKNLFQMNSKKINAEIRAKLIELDEGNSNLLIHSLANPIADEEFGLYTKRLVHYSKPNFERIDVSFSILYGIEFFYDNNRSNSTWSEFKNRIRTNYKVEIKPTISDDFPSVLRQMKAAMPVKPGHRLNQNYYVLLIGNYTGIGASKEEFIEYFNSQGYKVVFEKEINEIELPKFDRELILEEDIKDKIKKHHDQQ